MGTLPTMNHESFPHFTIELNQDLEFTFSGQIKNM